MDDFIKEKKAIEFLKVEYKVKKFIEETLNIQLGGDVSQAARYGIAVNFLNVLRPPGVKYNTNPTNAFQFIENINFFNNICLDESKFGNLFNQVDVVDSANVTKPICMVQVLNNLHRVIKYVQAQQITDRTFVEDDKIPQFRKEDITRASIILEDVANEKKLDGRGPNLDLVEMINSEVAGEVKDRKADTNEEKKKPDKREKPKDNTCLYIIIAVFVLTLIVLLKR